MKRLEARTKFKDDKDRELYYAQVLSYPFNDVIARALDAFGWEIRPAPEYKQHGRWMMHDGGETLPWADDDPEGSVLGN
jgi:hypothetical protein